MSSALLWQLSERQAAHRVLINIVLIPGGLLIAALSLNGFTLTRPPTKGRNWPFSV